LALGLFIMALPLPAAAYIGPGAGLSAIGSLVALVGAFFLLLAGFVWYPVKRLLRGRASAGSEPSGSGATHQDK
jgi:hypothetical protein